MATHNLTEYHLTTEIPDVSEVPDSLVVVPDAGKLVKVQSVLAGAIATANSVVTITADGGAVGTLTITQSGSAEGDVDTLDCNVSVSKGSYIKAISSAASTNSIPLGITYTIRR